MRLKSTAITIVLAAVTLAGEVSLAHAQSCGQLWYERNSYYKEAGYCFKTPRAIRVFGNRGCIFNNEGDVPLSGGVRARIAQIVRLERAMGCSD